jgi:hypothetical protein
MNPSNRVTIDTRCYSDYATKDDRQEYVWTEAQEAREKSGWKPNESQDIFVRVSAPGYEDNECELSLCEFSDQSKDPGGITQVALVPMHADQMIALAQALLFTAHRMKGLPE